MCTWFMFVFSCGKSFMIPKWVGCTSTSWCTCYENRIHSISLWLSSLNDNVSSSFLSNPLNDTSGVDASRRIRVLFHLCCSSLVAHVLFYIVVFSLACDEKLGETMRNMFFVKRLREWRWWTLQVHQLVDIYPICCWTMKRLFKKRMAKQITCILQVHKLGDISSSFLNDERLVQKRYQNEQCAHCKMHQLVDITKAQQAFVFQQSLV